VRTFGKYRLLERVASGGMAEVWRAEAPGAEGFVKEVALKLIRGDHHARGGFERMFIQEARLASRLTHANIVQVFDFDQVDGRYYIAMEFVRGHTLRDVVDRCHELGLRLGLARSVHVCAEVARALAYAHRFEEGGRPPGGAPRGALGKEGGFTGAALVHRDVSPQNVLLSFEGEVKLTDFGIARALGAAEETAPGTIKGKLAYMAPEQARGESVDGRADVFAVGVLLWELCTGRRLFARDSDAATLAAVIAPQPISPPSAWNEAVPPELDALTLAALDHDVARRTATAEELAAALASIRLRLANGHEDLDLRALMRRLWPEGATPAELPAPDGTAVRTVPSPTAALPEELSTKTVARPPPRARARVWLGMAIMVLVAAAGGSAGWKAWRGKGRAQSAALPPSSPPTPLASPTPSVPFSPALTPPPMEVEHSPSSSTRTPAPTVAILPSLTRSQSPSPMLSPLRGAMETERPPSSSAVPSTATATPTSPPTTSRATPTPASTPPSAATPAIQRSEGSISVHATPWAYVTIDGAAAGETPIERTLPPGLHRLRARHPTLGDDEIRVNLAPGQRYVWKPKLTP
jgi:serine/threonine-protein kinase